MLNLRIFTNSKTIGHEFLIYAVGYRPALYLAFTQFIYLIYCMRIRVSVLRKFGACACFRSADYAVQFEIKWLQSLASTSPGMPGTHPLQYIGWGDVNGNIPTNIITYVRIYQTNISRPHTMTAFNDVFYSLFWSKIQNLPQNRRKPH